MDFYTNESLLKGRILVGDIFVDVECPKIEVLLLFSDFWWNSCTPKSFKKTFSIAYISTFIFQWVENLAHLSAYIISVTRNIQIRNFIEQATEELHARIAQASGGASLAAAPAAELLDDAELLLDERDTDQDVSGECIQNH